MSIRLRDYQDEAVAAIRTDLAEGVTRPACVLPTGGGKTIVFADLAAKEAGRGKALIIAHRDELITQAADKYRSVNPGARVGIVKAGQNEVDAPVVVSSVQTLARENRRAQLRDVGLVIVDECHHATAQSYRDVLAFYDVPAVGFTATLARGDGKALGDIWQKISYEMPLLKMIRKGFLTDVQGVQIKVPDLDLANLHKTAGDYREGELGDRLADSMAPETVAKAYRTHGVRPDGSIRPGILFAPTVATAQVFTDALNAEGIVTAAIWGAMPLEDRRRVLREFDEGKIDVLSNCMVLTEGFDSPRAEVCVIARPTASAPLYIQMVGRVLRLFPGKFLALVLDVVGAAAKHELCTLATLGGDRVKEIKEGKTLLKALDEVEEETEVDDVDASGYVGDVEAVTVDLFAGSRQQWLQTHAGYWFIPAGERIIALVPAKDSPAFDVVWFATKKKGGGYVARNVLDLGMAMAHGEGAITWEEELYGGKDRAWRKSKASVAQRNYAKALGIKVDTLPDKIRAGQLGDLISIALASKRIDRLIGAKRA
jgi:superfamily II DNA or RNA helicase